MVIVNIQYFAIGNNNLSKEYMEVHFDGKSFTMDDYKTLVAYGIKIDPITSRQQDKGHYQELIELSRALVEGINPVSIDQLFQTSKVAIQLNKM